MAVRDHGVGLAEDAAGALEFGTNVTISLPIP